MRGCTGFREQDVKGVMAQIRGDYLRQLFIWDEPGETGLWENIMLIVAITLLLQIVSVVPAVGKTFTLNYRIGLC